MGRFGSFLVLLSILSLSGRRAEASAVPTRHGSSAVVCRDIKGAILSAELLDLFEAESLSGLALLDLKDGKISEFSAHASDLFHEYPTYLGFLRAMLIDLSPKFRMLPIGRKLALAAGIYPMIKRRGCAIEQLALARDAESDILIDSQIYGALSPTSRLGFELHVASDALERMWVEAPDSRRARRLVGEMLSVSPSDFAISSILRDYPGVALSPGRYSDAFTSVEECQFELAIDDAGLPIILNRIGKCSDLDEVFLSDEGPFRFSVLLSAAGKWELETKRGTGVAAPRVVLESKSPRLVTLAGKWFRKVLPGTSSAQY